MIGDLLWTQHHKALFSVSTKILYVSNMISIDLSIVSYSYRKVSIFTVSFYFLSLMKTKLKGMHVKAK